MQDENTDGEQSLLNNVRMHDQSHTLAQKFANVSTVICTICIYVMCVIISLYSIQEREVDTPDGLGCSLTATAQYVYNSIHDEPQAKVSRWRDENIRNKTTVRRALSRLT